MKVLSAVRASELRISDLIQLDREEDGIAIFAKIVAFHPRKDHVEVSLHSEDGVDFHTTLPNNSVVCREVELKVA